MPSSVSPRAVALAAGAVTRSHAVDQRDADEPVRPRRQLRPRPLARAARPAAPPSPPRRATTRSWCGDRHAAREFLHVDDLARACLLLLDTYDEPEPVNVGTGSDVTIRELASDQDGRRG
jgi:NAD dependent epimerase/dehydratase family